MRCEVSPDRTEEKSPTVPLSMDSSVSFVTFHHHLSSRAFVCPLKASSAISDVRTVCKDHFNFFYDACISEIPSERPNFTFTEYGQMESTSVALISEQSQWTVAFATWKKRADTARRGKKLSILHELSSKLMKHRREHSNNKASVDDLHSQHAIGSVGLNNVLRELYELFYPPQNCFLIESDMLRYIKYFTLKIYDAIRDNKTFFSKDSQQYMNLPSGFSGHCADAESCAIALQILWRLSESPKNCIRILECNGIVDTNPKYIDRLLQLLSSLGDGAFQYGIYASIELNTIGLLSNLLFLGANDTKYMTNMQQFTSSNTFKQYAEALLCAIVRPMPKSEHQDAEQISSYNFQLSKQCLTKALYFLLHEPIHFPDEFVHYYEFNRRKVLDFIVEERKGTSNWGIKMLIELVKCEDTMICYTGLATLLLVGIQKKVFTSLSDDIAVDVFNAALAIAHRSIELITGKDLCAPYSQNSHHDSCHDGVWYNVDRTHEYDLKSEAPALNLHTAVFLMWIFAKRLAFLDETPQFRHMLWIDTLVKISVLSVVHKDPRVRPDVAYGALGCLAAMASGPAHAANPYLLSNLLKLTLPDFPIIIRNNSCLALARIAIRHLTNLSDRPIRADGCDPRWRKWIKVSQVLLLSKSVLLIYGCAEIPTNTKSPSRMSAIEAIANVKMRDHASYALAALFLSATSSQGLESMKDSDIARPCYLLACNTSIVVLRSAAVILWALGRQNSSTREVLGKNGAVERLLNVITWLESDCHRVIEKEDHSFDTYFVQLSTLSWSTAALWVLCRSEKNGKVVASSATAVDILCRISRSCFINSAAAATATAATSSISYNWAFFSLGGTRWLVDEQRRAERHIAVLGLACLGTLRSCICTPYGQYMLHENHLGFTLTSCLLSVLSTKNSRATAPALREASGLLYTIHTSPLIRRLAEQLHGSENVLEDTIGALLKGDYNKFGQNYPELISDSAIILGSLAMRTISAKYLVEIGIVAKLAMFLDSSTSFKYFECRPSDLARNLECIHARAPPNQTGGAAKEASAICQPSLDTMKFCVLRAILNFSALPTAHRDICEFGLGFLVDISQSSATRGQQLACRIILNLAKSNDPNVRKSIYKVQLTAASSAIARRIAQVSNDSKNRRGNSSLFSNNNTVVVLPRRSMHSNLYGDHQGDINVRRRGACFFLRDAKLSFSDRRVLQSRLRGNVGRVWQHAIDLEKVNDADKSTESATADVACESEPTAMRFSSISPIVPAALKSCWKPPIILQYQEEGSDNNRETLVLEPAVDFNHVTFDEDKRFLSLKQESRNGIWRFPAVQGARLYKHIMPTLSSLVIGEHYYYYSHSTVPYEALPTGKLLPPEDPAQILSLGIEIPVPNSTCDFEGSALPTPTMRDRILPMKCPRIRELYLESTRLACSLLNGKDVIFDEACVGEPAILEVAFPVSQKGEGGSDSVTEDSHWTVQESIFSQRINECDAHDFFNTKYVWDVRFARDWKRNISRERFKKLLIDGNKEIKDNKCTLEDEVSAVKDVLRENWPMLMSIYQWFVSVESDMSEGGIQSLAMKAGSYKAFIDTVMKGRTQISTTEALTRIFLSVNLGENKSDDMQKNAEDNINPSSAIIVHEWMEALVRCALVLHGKEKVMRGSAAMCLRRFLSGPYIQEQIQREARQNLDDYRKWRLYREDVNFVLKDHEVALRGVYLAYSYATMARSSERSGIKRIQKKFFIDSWQLLLSEAGIFDHTRVDRVQAKLCFLWSRMVSIDEYSRIKESSLTFIDFLEALARLSDVFCCGSIDVPLGYSSGQAENLEILITFMLENISTKCKGNLKIRLEGHSANGKKAADLSRYYRNSAQN